jgi:hypothetical protein
MRTGSRCFSPVRAPLTLMLAGLLCVMAPAAAQGRGLSFPAHFTAGTNPHSLAMGDLNGDAKPDLAVANQQSGDVSILLGNGSGGFTGPTNFPAGTNPSAIAIGNFSADANPDLAVVNNGSNNVSILLGDGRGGFTGPTNFSVGDHPFSVAVGNFNGDPNPDLAVANLSTIGAGSVSILLGKGSGGFTGPTDFPAGGRPSAVVVGSFDADANQDLAVTNINGGSVSILLGNGSGGFGVPTSFSAGTSPFRLAAGDLNGDTKPDLAVASSGNASILLGNGSGGFTGPTNFPVDGGPTQSIAIGDFDGDGSPDLAVASASIKVLLGNGSGGFGPFINLGSSAYSIVAGDLNGDTNPDLAVANLADVQVLMNVQPTLSINDISAPEGDSGQQPFNFTAALSAYSLNPVQVDVHTEDGTATLLDSDYAALPVQTLNFAPAQVSQNVTVNVNGDFYYEPDETFDVKLSNSTGAAIADDTGVGTIQNDEQPGYPRPKDASPLRVPLVVAFNKCNAPNRVHGPPLAFDSCSPPIQRSQYLTVGTGDANGAAANSVGSVRYSVIPGDPATPANEADVGLDVSITDVRGKATLGDYIAELWTTVAIRLTDRFQAPPETTSDFEFHWAIPCARTADTTVGGTCALNTTADAVVPGSVVERARTVWELGQVQVQDGGEDGVGSTTSDNTLFLKQGIFVP